MGKILMNIKWKIILYLSHISKNAKLSSVIKDAKVEIQSKRLVFKKDVIQKQIIVKKLLAKAVKKITKIASWNCKAKC